MAEKDVVQTLRVGDLVKFPVGAKTFRGEIAEDRGPIGVRGRTLYRIMVKIDGNTANIELPADQLLVVGRKKPAKNPIRFRKASSILKSGKKARVYTLVKRVP
jgi:hypothetical protein